MYSFRVTFYNCLPRRRDTQNIYCLLEGPAEPLKIKMRISCEARKKSGSKRLVGVCGDAFFPKSYTFFFETLFEGTTYGFAGWSEMQVSTAIGWRGTAFPHRNVRFHILHHQHSHESKLFLFFSSLSVDGKKFESLRVADCFFSNTTAGGVRPGRGKRARYIFLLVVKWKSFSALFLNHIFTATTTTLVYLR